LRGRNPISQIRRKGDLMSASKAVLLFSVGLFCWLGCGGDSVCDKAQHDLQNLANATSSCPTFSGGGDGGATLIISFNKASCQNALSQCSSADQQTLSNYFDCLGKVNPCVPGQENQFLASLVYCYLSAGNLSQACQSSSLFH
jgi:hypothetical protein